MKLNIYLTLVISFLALNAMKCNNNLLHKSSNLVDINVENLNNEDKKLSVAHSPIKRESYTLGIKYIGKNSEEHPYLYYYQDSIIEQKIYCNNQFDDKHPAGSDITNLFVPYPCQQYNGAKLKLTKTPTPGMHSFKICVHRKNGKSIIKDTAPIEFY